MNYSSRIPNSGVRYEMALFYGAAPSPNSVHIIITCLGISSRVGRSENVDLDDHTDKLSLNVMALWEYKMEAF